MRLAAGVVVVLLLAGGAAHARDTVAEGRYHLRKANALAGDDRCAAAIREYTLAFDKLHDPVVLFNRAECDRRIGNAKAAIADYRAFLAAVPKAPNRADVEAKIAALEPALQPARASVSPVAPPSVGPAAPAPAPNVLAAPEPPPPVEAPAAPAIAPPAETTEAPPPATADRHGGFGWVWAALGVAVAGGAVGAYFALRTPGTTPPATELGNYRF